MVLDAKIDVQSRKMEPRGRQVGNGSQKESTREQRALAVIRSKSTATGVAASRLATLKKRWCFSSGPILDMSGSRKTMIE